MDSRLSRWLDGFLEAAWLAAILAIPLFFNIQSERVFEPDKIALLRSLALVMGAAWCVKFVDRKGWQRLDVLRPSNPNAIWHRPMTLVIFALLAVYLVATVFSINPTASWAGSYQRLQGTYTTFAYVVIFAIMAATITSRAQIRRVVTVAIITSIPVAFYGLLQHFGLDPLPWGGDVTERVAGHMGNAIFIAAYLIMVVPLTVARIIDAFSDILTQDDLSVADITRSSVYIFALAIQLLTIYWSGSRGPLIGLVVGLFAFMLVLLVSLRDAGSEEGSIQSNPIRQALPALWILLPSLVALLLSKPVSDATSPLIGFVFFMGTVAISVLAIVILMAMGRGWKWLWLGWILLTAFAGLWLVGFNIVPARSAALQHIPLVGGVVASLDEWRELPTIGSYGRMLDASATTGREKSGRVRVLIWEGVVDLIAPHDPLRYPDGRADPFNFLRPLIGYGPESMYVAYNRFYPAELATVEARNASPDRSHNETFDALVITGLLGFLAWQAVYLSVIYFAFRYLAVIRSRRDTWVFIGLLVGGAMLGAVGVIVLAESIYLGVAVPTGVMAGVIGYLIYFALFSRPAAPDGALSSRQQPFAVDRLLMNALVAAVLAHYVEIHFGIAISATRLYFFVYVALMVALAHSLPRLVTVDVPAAAAPVTPKGRRRTKTTAVTTQSVAPESTGWSQLVLVGLLLVLALGIMGYSFMTYSLPPGTVITGSADLSAMDIFRQAFLQNASRDYVGSPFIFAMMILTWGLGWLIALSEMAKHGELPFSLSIRGNGAVQKPLLAATLFVLTGLAALAGRLLLPGPVDAAGVLGRSLLLVWGFVSLLAGGFLFLGLPSARVVGGVVAGIGLAFSPAAAIGGDPLWGVVLAGLCGLLLFLLREPGWGQSLLPVIGLAAASLTGGLLYTYLHAQRYRASIFFQSPAGITDIAELRGLEALGAEGLLTFFYAFIFLMVILMAFAIAWPSLHGNKLPVLNTPLAGLAFVVFMGGAFFLVATTNMRVIQADMIFKRGRPFDDQATRAVQADPAALRDTWDAAIAVYNRAIDRAPNEDFYYLFLGRALLERSGAAQDALDRLAYLQEAEARLLEAQAINPLNTDHTANLARLYTRWYGVAADDSEREQRLDQSEQAYRQALALSPQNSVIRNEMARLVLELRQDCPQALAIYDESAEIDPFYTLTFLARADAYVLCGSTLAEPARTTHYETAAASLVTALSQQPSNLRAWVQLAEVYREIERYPAALDALREARLLNGDGRFPTSEMDFIEARIQAGMGETAEARVLATQALAGASAELAGQIETFLADLDAGGGPSE